MESDVTFSHVQVGTGAEIEKSLPAPPPPKALPRSAAAAPPPLPPSSSSEGNRSRPGMHKFFTAPIVGYPDMIKLPDLEEAALLDNLERRFRAEVVYTYIGDIVVSVNPFKQTGDSDWQVQSAYASRTPESQLSELPPHIFCLVSQAYARMRASSARSLSILISGESGAGKTEAMKLCVSHLGAIAAMASGHRSPMGTTGESVSDQLMKTNPIMEPIGNAKTVRNNNSSRFGKHFDIQFDHHGQVAGALTSVYLLEKPRITNHMQGERNYHVFYMLCKAPAEVRQPGQLEGWERYAILCQEGTVERVESWNDRNEFSAMHAALQELGFTAEQRTQLYMMIAIVLHLGNVGFDALELPDGDGSAVRDESQLQRVAALMQVTRDQLFTALTQTTLVVGLDEFTQDLPPLKATAALHSMCMHIYSLAFGWCVRKINDTIAKPDSEVHRTVGVLDIFGFENFNAKGQTNSFPQLCINLTNERLHQLFIEHIFEVEQRFYQSEDIEWTRVDYSDNKRIIELIAKRPGIFALIDDECQKRTTTNDNALLSNLHEAFDRPPHAGKTYERPKKPGTFVIHHYAGEVLYKIDGFIEKNKDDLSPTISTLLEQHTSFEQLRDLAKTEKRRLEVAVLDREAAKRAGGGRKANVTRTRKKTVSESFGESLNLLMAKLGSTDHHYIRCLKPNHTLRPADFDRELMLRQLAYSGTLEVTKVRKAGLNVRWELSRFYDWYKICAKDLSALRAGTQREQVQLLLRQCELDAATWRVGRTLVFMASQDVLEQLDILRQQRVKEYALLIMMHWKMRKEYKGFKLKQQHARQIQHALRGLRTKRAYETVRNRTRLLQHAALVKLARMRAEELKADPSRFGELLNRDDGALDEMVNEDTGEKVSLSQSIALRQLFPEAHTAEEHRMHMRNMTTEQRDALAARRQELAGASPAELIEEATVSQLSSLVLASMLWQRSGVQVRVAGRIQRTADEPKLPRFRLDAQGRGAPWSAVVRVAIETLPIASNDDTKQCQGSNTVSRAPRQSAAMGYQSTARQISSMDKARELYASIRHGTLTLEEVEGVSAFGTRRLVGTFPLSHCTLDWMEVGASAGDGDGGEEGRADEAAKRLLALHTRPLVWEGAVSDAPPEQSLSTLVKPVTQALLSAASWLVDWSGRRKRFPVPAGRHTGTPVERSHHADSPEASPVRLSSAAKDPDSASQDSSLPCAAAAQQQQLVFFEASGADRGSVPEPHRVHTKQSRDRTQHPVSSPGADMSLEDFASVLEDAIADSRRVDDFVVRPRAAPPSTAASAATASPAASGVSSASDVGKHRSWTLPVARQGAPVVKEGFVLRQMNGQWGRRYLVLLGNGMLYWYHKQEDFQRTTAEQASALSAGLSDSTSGLSSGTHLGVRAPLGQLTLRFFAASRCNDSGPTSHAFCEEPEIHRMLSSCTLFEVRSGNEVLLLAAQRVVAQEWITALTTQCLLNYPKSPVFSDKTVQVLWMDGRQYTCAVGENTTAQDIVQRLCRSRKVDEGGNQVTLVSDPSEWALFEAQRHDVSDPCHAGSTGVVPNTSLHKLSNDEPILDQLLLRWEVAARRIYGAAPIAPHSAFQLLLRKVKGGCSPWQRRQLIRPEEENLEVHQARFDLLDGRLASSLGEIESMELAAVLSLWEMHRRGPRTAKSFDRRGNTRAAIQMQLREKQSNPTLDFDILLSELPSVLPARLCAHGEGKEEQTRRLKELEKKYRLLLKDKLDSWSTQPAPPQSETAQLIKSERKEALGVSFDAKGQVVVDRRAAERILRTRLANDPLCFGTTFSAYVWTGTKHAPQQRLVALNHQGLHLFTSEHAPKRLGSLLFAWQSRTDSGASTIVGWQDVPHQLTSPAERDLVEELSYGTVSLVIHVLAPPRYIVERSAAAYGGDTGSRTSSGIEWGSASDERLVANDTVRLGQRPKQDSSVGRQLALKLDERHPLKRTTGGVHPTLRSQRAKQAVHRQRAKLVLLMREGEDLKWQLQCFANEHVQKLSREAGKGPASEHVPPTGRPVLQFQPNAIKKTTVGTENRWTDRLGMGAKLGMWTAR